MRSRDTERRRDRGTDDTQETEDVPPLAASVKTLQEAVQLSLQGGFDEKSLFKYSRALRAFEITNNRRLPASELPAVFVQWWNVAKPQLPPDADFDEYRFDFEDTFAKTRAALGANSLKEAIRRADANPMPPQAARYNSPRLKRLVAVCYHLQVLQGHSPFFLGVRDAAKILGTNDLNQANAILAGLVRDGILTLAEKGTRKRATRYRFVHPEPVPAGETGSPTQTNASVGVIAAEPKAGSKLRRAVATNRHAPREPSPYELAVKKKALQELIKGFGQGRDRDDWDSEEELEFKRLNAELHRVNDALSRIGS